MAKNNKKELDEITEAKRNNVVKKPVSDEQTVKVGNITFTIKK